MIKIILSLMFCIFFVISDSLRAENYEGYPERNTFESVSGTSTVPTPTATDEGYPQRDVKLIRGATPSPACKPGTALNQTPYNEFEGYPRARSDLPTQTIEHGQQLG